MEFQKQQIFNGLTFTRDEKTGYYLNSTIRQRMHRYVWEYCNGTIPAGYHIHHKDFDRSNNDIANLQLLTSEEHERLHAEIHIADEKLHIWKKSNLARNARPKASQWHKSAEGREWHKKQFEQSRSRILVERDFICSYCGKPFRSTQSESRFCSNKCKSAYRRKSGVDNETRICVACGNEFTVNRYSKSETCGRACASARAYSHRAVAK